MQVHRKGESLSFELEVSNFCLCSCCVNGSAMSAVVVNGKAELFVFRLGVGVRTSLSFESEGEEEMHVFRV